MDTEKLKKIVGPAVEKIRAEKIEKTNTAFRSLAELLVEWYDRQFPSKQNEQTNDRT